MAALVIVAGIIAASKEAFFESRFYVTQAAFDSKNIGLLIRGQPEEIPVVIYEYPSDQTIQYYAERPASHLAAGGDNSISPSLFLVIPTELVRQNQWLEKFFQPYRGENLTLVSVR